MRKICPAHVYTQVIPQSRAAAQPGALSNGRTLHWELHSCPPFPVLPSCHRRPHHPPPVSTAGPALHLPVSGITRHEVLSTAPSALHAVHEPRPAGLSPAAHSSRGACSPISHPMAYSSIHPPVVGRVSCLRLLAIVNKTSVYVSIAQGHMLTLVTFGGTPNCFPEWPCDCTVPSVVHEVLGSVWPRPLLLSDSSLSGTGRTLTQT